MEPTKYHVLPLTTEEIANGALFHISDTLSEASAQSVKAAQEAGRRGELVELRVGFDNSSTNSAFHDQWDDEILDVLYMNEAAHNLLVSANLGLTFQGTVDELPQGCGTMARMYLVR